MYVRRTNKMHTFLINDNSLYCSRHVVNNEVFIIRNSVQATLRDFIKQTSRWQDVFDTKKYNSYIHILGILYYR